MPHHVFIETTNSELTSQGKTLIIRRPDMRPSTLPLTQISSVLIHANTRIDTTTLLKLQRENIPLTISDHRHQTVVKITGDITHGHVQRRLAHYAIATNSAHCIALSRQLIRWKMHAQWQNLLHWRHKYPKLRRPITICMQIMKRLIKRLRTCDSLQQVRGLEAAASRAEFRAFRTIVSPSWGFTHRNRRPPKDPVNALLSLAFTLLHGEAEHALKLAGLDPMLGVLHEPAYNRSSLGCDLSELFRSRMMSWVLYLIRNQSIQTTDFSTNTSGCLLLKSGRGIFYREWYAQRDALAADLQQTARCWAKRLEDHGTAYHLL